MPAKTPLNSSSYTTFDNNSGDVYPNNFYRLELPKDSSVNLQLVSQGSSQGSTQYLPPSIQLFDSRGNLINTSSNAISQSLNAGVYYAEVSQSSGYTNYALQATATPSAASSTLQIRGITPDHGSNTGQVTLTVDGTQFTPDASIRLVAPSGTAYTATQVKWLNDTELTAAFNLQGLASGTYNVQLVEGSGTTIAQSAFTVNNGAAGQLETYLSAPGVVRNFWTGQVTVTYRNAGNTDIPAPVFTLSADNALFRQSGQTDFTSNSVQFLGINPSGMAGVLPPGASGTYTIQFKPNATASNINFSLSTLTLGAEIDWSSIQNSSQPANIPTDAWNVIYKNFTTAVGTTTDSYQTALDQTASALSQLGQTTTDVSQLLGFEFQQASDSLTGTSLTSEIDAAAPAPGGLTLTFGRTYLQSLVGRFTAGSLGLGWTEPWDIAATTDSSGNVTIQSAGSSRTFIKQSDGSYKSQTGDYGTLTLVGGTYHLQEKDGTLISFLTSGHLDYIQDTTGNRITATYTGNQLTKLTHSDGDSFTLSYNAQGHLSQLTDQSGQITTYSYDATGQHLLSVTGPGGTTSYTYDTTTTGATANALLSITYPDGTHTFFSYDSQGRLIRESQDGAVNAVTYSYDATGGVTVTDATGASTKLLLNDLGQVGQTQDALGRVTQFQYDGNGNLTSVVSPGDTISSFSYNSQGNLLSTTDPLGQHVNFTYNSQFNQVQSVQDQRGNVTAYGYDSQGNLKTLTYADGSTDTFGYDTQGNLTVSTNRLGQTIRYTYNSQGLLTRKDYPDGTSATYTYDNRGNLLTATDAAGTVSYTYDSANRITKVTEPSGTLQFTYDAGGRRTQMVDQTGAITDYAYDAAGRLSKLTDGSGKLITAYSYDAAGRLSREDNGNGTYTAYSYDAAGEVLSIVHYAASGSINSRYDYTYDNLGRRTSMTTLEGTMNYGYDAAGQLTSVVLPSGRTIQYAYDAAGNRITVSDSGATTTYTTNNLNEYTSVGGATNVYDADGNLVSTTQNGQTTTYTYDSENRLIGVTTPTDTWRYKYDALGNRIASIHNGQQTNYLLDPTGLGNVVGEYSDTGSQIASYTYGLGLVSRSDTTNGTDFYDTDAIGSVVGLSGSTGSYLDKYSYLPFGESLTRTETIANPFEYVGQFGVMDEGNGLDFLRARFYDSLEGRFLNTDPSLQEGGINLYKYTGNNPITSLDPSERISK